ncbi:Bug family tripartite tricarboxylate transporter substrate binding protein [uncultured Pseudacidovorax sp.]|uniref:Bug family tripartite tricarboxylate transporter substrate binding protein n=1 Tax=uncultured Pseudacidovorax sp. TaxID=679313 RepID=UPI0025FA4E1C|nr:Bug family tripartite tricarboxylate transporter substrate binding protein [uncultured Pseudacidovorax sp.]
MTARRTFHRLAAGLVAAAALASLAGPATAQAAAPAFDGPLRVVVGYAPGGATDRVARIVADRLTVRLGVPVVVDNKAGAGGRLAAQQLKNAPAGQNVVMVANPAVMVVAPLVFKDNGYDPERDFQPISNVNNYEFGLAVGAAVPVKQLTHLLAWMKANPEKANVGVPATGSLPHFFALMLGQKAHVKTEVVGYRGSAGVLTDLIGGQIPIAVDTFDGLLPQYESGKLRILAMSGTKRSPFAPDVPTFKEAGLDLSAMGWNAFFAPASMPRDKVDRLAREIREVMQEPDTQRKFTDAKMLPVVSTRAETEAMVKAFRAQWAPIIQTSGYQP